MGARPGIRGHRGRRSSSRGRIPCRSTWRRGRAGGSACWFKGVLTPSWAKACVCTHTFRTYRGQSFPSLPAQHRFSPPGRVWQDPPVTRVLDLPPLQCATEEGLGLSADRRGLLIRAAPGRRAAGSSARSLTPRRPPQRWPVMRRRRSRCSTGSCRERKTRSRVRASSTPPFQRCSCLGLGGCTGRGGLVQRDRDFIGSNAALQGRRSAGRTWPASARRCRRQSDGGTRSLARSPRRYQ